MFTRSWSHNCLLKVEIPTFRNSYKKKIRPLTSMFLTKRGFVFLTFLQKEDPSADLECQILPSRTFSSGTNSLKKRTRELKLLRNNTHVKCWMSFDILESSQKSAHEYSFGCPTARTFISGHSAFDILKSVMPMPNDLPVGYSVVTSPKEDSWAEFWECRIVYRRTFSSFTKSQQPRLPKGQNSQKERIHQPTAERPIQND